MRLLLSFNFVSFSTLWTESFYWWEYRQFKWGLKEIQENRVTALELPDIEVRKQTGLSQVEFAARLHISHGCYRTGNKVRRSSDFNPYSGCTPKCDLKRKHSQ